MMNGLPCTQNKEKLMTDLQKQLDLDGIAYSEEDAELDAMIARIYKDFKETYFKQFDKSGLDRTSVDHAISFIHTLNTCFISEMIGDGMLVTTRTFTVAVQSVFDEFEQNAETKRAH